MCETGRLFTCGWCRRQVVICRSCDRGHRYCCGTCSRLARAERRREARRRYQRTDRGRETGRSRQRRYRIRVADRVRAMARAAAGCCWAALAAALEKTVTDHPSVPQPEPLPAGSAARSGGGSPLRCAACGRICTHLALADP